MIINVCMHACMDVWMYVPIYICVCMCVRVSIHLPIYLCMRLHACVLITYVHLDLDSRISEYP